MLRRIFAEHGARSPAMIVEPVMMNAGIIKPAPGFLEGVRDLTRQHGALLAFDEVKTGLTVGPGGATRLFGVTPGHDVPGEGHRRRGVHRGHRRHQEVMALIAEGEYEQVGTFNGNPLAMAAARAALTEVLTDAAYEHFARSATADGRGVRGRPSTLGPARLRGGHRREGLRHVLPDPVRNYRDFLAIDDRYSHVPLAVPAQPWRVPAAVGKAEQWMLSVQHTLDDADRFVENFAGFAQALRS